MVSKKGTSRKLVFDFEGKLRFEGFEARPRKHHLLEVRSFFEFAEFLDLAGRLFLCVSSLTGTESRKRQ
jgi:hypothetical protein